MEKYLNYENTSLETFHETDNFSNSLSVNHSDHNNTTNSTEWIDETTRMVVVISFPIIIVLGTIGNALTFIVMRRGSLKRSSTCFYMAILAPADTGEYLSFLRVDPTLTWIVACMTLRFISCALPVSLFTAIIATELSWPTYLHTYRQALVRLEPYHWACCSTDLQPLEPLKLILVSFIICMF